LDNNETDKLLEVLRMTDLGTMLVVDARKDEKMEIAKKLLMRGISVSAVVEDTGLDESTVRRLQAELEVA